MINLTQKIIVRIILILFISLTISSCEKELSISPDIGPVPVGFITIDSNPQGALIYEDGRNTGKITPDTLNWLEERDYKITLKKNLFRDTLLTVRINKNDSQNIYVDYYKNNKMLGDLYCNSNAKEASIYFNDSLLQEKTPARLKFIKPGNYRIAYSKDGYRKDSTIVTVESNQTADASIMLSDTSVWVDYTTKTSLLPDNYIVDVDVDDNNVVWVATHSEGLVKVDGDRYEIYNVTNSPIPGDILTKVKVDQFNRVWVASNGGAGVLENGSWSIYTTNTTPMKDNYSTSIEVEDDGTFWIGTHDGLMRNKEGTWVRFDSVKSGLPHRWVTDVAKDGVGNIWVGTKIGLAKFTSSGEWFRYVNFTHPDYLTVSFPSNLVTKITAKNSEVWVSFAPNPITKIGGLVQYNGRTFNTSFVPLPSHNFNNLDWNFENNRKWFSTKDGLLTFINFTTKRVYRHENTEMPVDDVRAVAFNKKDNSVWVATFGGGLFRFKKNF